MEVIVLTVDQNRSKTSPDHVPFALQHLASVPTLRGFERTVGDEFQGVLTSPDAFAQSLQTLFRQGNWNIGVGIGSVEQPLPDSTREGRGPAFLHARTAVTKAKSSPWKLRVIASHEYARWLETTCWLWASVLARRTRGGWDVADLVDHGASYDQAAAALNISPSAVSQRAQAAGIAEGRRAWEMITELTSAMLRSPENALG